MAYISAEMQFFQILPFSPFTHATINESPTINDALKVNRVPYVSITIRERARFSVISDIDVALSLSFFVVFGVRDLSDRGTKPDPKVEVGL